MPVLRSGSGLEAGAVAPSDGAPSGDPVPQGEGATHGSSRSIPDSGYDQHGFGELSVPQCDATSAASAASATHGVMSPEHAQHDRNEHTRVGSADMAQHVPSLAGASDTSGDRNILRSAAAAMRSRALASFAGTPGSARAIKDEPKTVDSPKLDSVSIKKEAVDMGMSDGERGRDNDGANASVCSSHTECAVDASWETSKAEADHAYRMRKLEIEEKESKREWQLRERALLLDERRLELEHARELASIEASRYAPPLTRETTHEDPSVKRLKDRQEAERREALKPLSSSEIAPYKTTLDLATVSAVTLPATQGGAHV